MNIQSILTDILKIKFTQTGGDELLILCQNPRHQDLHPSCYINGITGLFHCHSCGFSGPIQRLIKVVLRDQAIPVLEELSLTSTSPKALADLIESIRGKPKPEPIKDLTKFTSILSQFKKESRFSTEMISKKWFYMKGGSIVDDYDIRHWVSMGTYYNRICIPIKDLDGNIVNFMWRAIEDHQKPKYLFLSHTECPAMKGEFMFLNNRVINTTKPVDDLFVVEGAFDAIYLDSIGLNAVSCLGTIISGKQFDKINKIAKKIHLFFDNDDAGVNGARSQYEKLKPYTNDIEIFFPYDKCEDYRSIECNTPNPKNPWEVPEEIIKECFRPYSY